jgi:endo-1,4-beta-xylanase
MRNSPWQQNLPNYIDIAFRTARRVDPHALLTYNDYGIEAEDENSTAKRAAVLALVRGMQKRGVPIDAVGIQSHIAAGVATPEIRLPAQHMTPFPTYLFDYDGSLKQFMADVQSLGLKILLTEMDVNDRALPADIPIRDKIVADVYAHYLTLTLANPAVLALLTWGITDRYTWLNHEDNRKDGLPQRCLPFDADLRPVPAFDAELHALQYAPSR